MLYLPDLINKSHTMSFCGRCDRYFRTWPAFNQHVNNSASHNICDECDIDFSDWSDLQDHWVESPYHSYCQPCNEHFDDDEELEDHDESGHSWCRQCNRFFANDYGRREHYRQSSVHFYCAPCDHLFQAASNLQAHLNSSIHRPRNVKCRGKGCDRTFVSVSAMILHLEGGKCVSGIDRSYVDQKVREYDRNNIITDPSRMITGSGSQSNSTYYATKAAWNGYAFECYLCHHTYNTLPILNQHLGSPRHQDKFYLCPLNTCRTRFSTLSALCQHIESERCGVHRFRDVKDMMGSVVGGMNRLTY
ncbi:hypothetical protein Agabi119p4_2370 [Agaricus bisporus var. burnettii]|uniref:C2H2-type domain-containing protein n=1 Tax=Agaricus bisporus var. burnettii TaxID=192524 RepID=A0A8H7F9B8_AGABI|nr:hypothetical protein Agabi119p4_2370 [Agaricus bisporus var. burnettii]